jgi:hypothetical protein
MLMSANREDQNRAQRIRDAQIKARDPGVSKIKGYDWGKHAKRAQQIKKAHEKPFLVDLFDLMPPRWKGALAGVLLGLVPLIAAQIFLQGEWKLLGLLPLMIFGVVGFVIGKATQHESPR